VIKKNDLILIGAVIILGLGIIFFINVTKTEGSKVLITIDGKEYDTFPLDEDTTFTVELDNGEYNTFVIKDGQVDMTEASCPDKVCVRHKEIHYNNETIVCLPNNVVLQIIGGEEDEIDAIAK
jgi:hypothetical protein